MGKGAETRRRMIEQTAVLLQRQGLNGTGLAQVLEASGLPKGSLYHHFPGGKEELAAAAMQLADEAVVRRIDRAWETAAADPATFGRELAEGYTRRLRRSDFADGCPVAAVALEGSPVSVALREASAAALGHWIAAIAAHLVDAGEAPERARTRATAAIALLEGGLILARATRSEEPMRAVGSELSRLLAG